MSRINLKFILGGAGVAALALMLRWNSFSIPLIRDEGEYAYSAWLLLQGIPPYLNSFLQKPPMIIYSYALPQLLGLYEPWVFRLLACLFVLGATIFTGLIAKKEFGTRVGIFAMLLLTPMVLLPNLEQFTANTEMFLLLPLLATCYLYNLKKGGASLRLWLLAGFFGGVSIYYKPTTVPILGFIFLVWIIETWSKDKSFFKIFKKLASSFLGFFIATIVTLGYFWHQDNLGSLLNILQFDRYYATVGSGGLSATWGFISSSFTNWWYLWILLSYFVFVRPRRWWFYLGLLLAAWLCSAGSWYGHYYILIMPFWAIICAASLDVLLNKIANRFKISSLTLNFVTPIIMVLVLVWPLKDWLILSPEKFAQQKFAGNPFVAAVDAAKTIRSLTAPTDKVLVAGSEPQILYYSKRQSATRFVIFYPLMIPTPMAEGYQADAIAEITKASPKLVILVNSPYSWLVSKDSPTKILDYLDTTLKTDYHVVETVSDGSDSQASFVIFEKK